MLSNLRPFLSTVTAGVHAVAGAVLGAGLQSKLHASPTKDQFIPALDALCPVLGSNQPNIRVCNETVFEALKPLFPDNVSLQIIIGALLIPTGGAIGFIPPLLHCLNRRNPDGAEVNNRAINFIDEVAYPVRNLIYGVGGAFLGNGIQTYVDQTLPPLQQVLNAACEGYAGSNTTLLCNTDQLERLAGILFAQPSSTTLMIGATLLGIMGAGSIGYGIYRCLTNTGGSAANEGDDEIDLSNLRVQNGSDESTHLVPTERPVSQNPLVVDQT